MSKKFEGFTFPIIYGNLYPEKCRHLAYTKYRKEPQTKENRS